MVYSFIFKAKWIRPDGSLGNYALLIFSGLILFVFTAEVLNSSTQLVMSNAALYKRSSVDPFAVPISNLLVAVFNFAMSAIPFWLLFVWQEGVPQLSCLLLPVIFLPYLFLVAGCSFWILSISVYVRDLQIVVPLLVTVLLFLSPVFYLNDQLPEAVGTLLNIFNPLSVEIQGTRWALFGTQVPSPLAWTSMIATSIASLSSGVVVYTFARRGFSDVM